MYFTSTMLYIAFGCYLLHHFRPRGKAHIRTQLSESGTDLLKGGAQHSNLEFDRLRADQLLYHTLQNPEYIDDQTTEVAKARLDCLLDSAFERGSASRDNPDNILSVRSYSIDTLSDFLSARNANTITKWSEYLSRRKAGGFRELLLDREHAEQWLEWYAPVKFVDGAWLLRQHRASKPEALRAVSRILWQIFSEELGDGDLRKNHVYLYDRLLRSFGSTIANGHDTDFIDQNKNPNDHANVWAAAVAQLALGLFPESSLPEVLGFNLAYECVAYETLVCAHEMQELGLDPEYFNLHITIDNADSGHTAMAMQAVIEYMKIPHSAHPDSLWRRIQTGFLLAAEIPSAPGIPSREEQAMTDLMSRKLTSGNGAHRRCKGLIGGLTGLNICDWMAPEGWDKRKHRFIRALANSRWVKRGQPNQSRLVKELTWGGRMFGAFTLKEVQIVEQWIRHLSAEYHTSSREQPPSCDTKQLVGLKFAPTTSKPAADNMRPKLSLPDSIAAKPQSISRHEILSMLLSLSVLPLQDTLSSPSKAANATGMQFLRILRLLNGFSAIPYEAVDGMDEVLHPGHGIMEFALLTSHISDDVQSRFAAQSTDISGLMNDLVRLVKDAHGKHDLMLGYQRIFSEHLFINSHIFETLGLSEAQKTSLTTLGHNILKDIELMTAGRTLSQEDLESISQLNLILQECLTIW